MHTLGLRTAELHRALATPTDDPAFAAEAITAEDVQLWRDRVRGEAVATLDLLSRPEELPEAVRQSAAELCGHRDALLARIESLARTAPAGVKIRHHGDYHLGQVLLQRNDFIIVDFEGEPARPLVLRREKSSPLRDVAGMLRSFAYARHAAMQRCTAETHEDCEKWQPLAVAWESEARAAFLSAYDACARAGYLYGSLEEVQPLLQLFELEKALYELRYELRNRPDWTSIPFATLLPLASADREQPDAGEAHHER
jgi:maltose alpha-D-glucosyltransferase/alpha-amylase